jgi:hypothetical protein
MAIKKNFEAVLQTRTQLIEDTNLTRETALFLTKDDTRYKRVTRRVEMLITETL